MYIFAITVPISDDVLTVINQQLCELYLDQGLFFLSCFARGRFDGKERMVTGCPHRQVRTNKSSEAYKNLLNNSQPNHGHMHTDRRWRWTKGVFIEFDWQASWQRDMSSFFEWQRDGQLDGHNYQHSDDSIYLVVVNGARS